MICFFRILSYGLHLATVERIMFSLDHSSSMAKEKMECPVCGISVKAENIEAHLKNVHPTKDVEIPELAKKKRKRVKKAAVHRTWPKWAGVLVVLIVVIATVLLLLPAPEEEPPNYAEPFFVIDVDGNEYDLNAGIGSQPILIEFFNPLGGLCKQMAPILNDLKLHFGNQLDIVSLSTASEADIIQFCEAYGSGWTFAHVSSGLLDDYGVTGLPHFVVVDKSGIIRFEDSGLITLDELKSAIEPWT